MRFGPSRPVEARDVRSDGSVLAAIDLGSNTVRLLVARTRGCHLEALLTKSAFVRLGQAVDATGLLQPERQERAIAILGDFAREARVAGAQQITVVATSAVREASNGAEFVQRVWQDTGLQVKIVAGEREAELTFLGATAGLSLPLEVLVVDLGGGSGEIVAARQGEVRWREALPIGSGRLTERFIRHDPPHGRELRNLGHHVRELLARLPSTDTRCGIFTGGTAKRIPVLLGLKTGVIQINADQVAQAMNVLSRYPVKRVVKEFAIEPGRAELLPAGVRALLEIAEVCSLEGITITPNGIREGIILDQLRTDGGWRAGGTGGHAPSLRHPA
jgi:exopolyphosphatase/pppGpp-phosphohydrolase